MIATRSLLPESNTAAWTVRYSHSLRQRGVDPESPAPHALAELHSSAGSGGGGSPSCAPRDALRRSAIELAPLFALGRRRVPCRRPCRSPRSTTSALWAPCRRPAGGRSCRGRGRASTRAARGEPGRTPAEPASRLRAWSPAAPHALRNAAYVLTSRATPHPPWPSSSSPRGPGQGARRESNMRQWRLFPTRAWRI